MRTLLKLVALLVGVAAPATAAAQGLHADMVVYNAKILTADSPDPDGYRVVQAIAVYDGKLIAVGTDEEALRYAGPETRRIDVAGRTIIPGLVETHSHVQGYGDRWLRSGSAREASVDWTSKEAGLAQLRTIAAQKKPGEWIALRGGLELGLLVRDGKITRADLDAVTPENPVRLASIFNSPTGDSFVNSKALEPLLARYPDLVGAHKDTKGWHTGWLSGVADQLITYEFMPLDPPDRLAPGLKIGLEELAAQGITTTSTRLAPQEIAGYGWLDARGEMPVRMAFSMEASARSQQPDAITSRLLGVQGGAGQNVWGLGNDKLWAIGLSPISIDSVPGIGGSCTHARYPREHPNFPNWKYQLYGPHGLCRLEDPNYRTAEELRAAAKYGLRITGLHTGGDKGIDQLLDIMEEMAKEYPDLPQRRWAIDHCRFLTDAHASRAKKLGVQFSCGPKYVFAGTRGDIGAYSVLYDQETAADVVVPLRRLIDQGLRTTMELDQQTFYSFLALEVAVTREDVNGKVWGPQQRVSRNEALYMYTRWSAAYVLREDRLGSLERGKLADFVVLDRDYLTVPEDEIGQIDPVLTVVGGEIAYSQPAFAQALALPVAGFQKGRGHWLRGTPDDVKRARGEGN